MPFPALIGAATRALPMLGGMMGGGGGDKGAMGGMLGPLNPVSMLTNAGKKEEPQNESRNMNFGLGIGG